MLVRVTRWFRPRARRFLRGIKDSPPYLHDGRLLTLEDTVEFFNLVQELKLTEREKADIVAFMRVL
jgi:cytochrome c peroxidase